MALATVRRHAPVVVACPQGVFAHAILSQPSINAFDYRDVGWFAASTEVTLDLVLVGPAIHRFADVLFAVIRFDGPRRI